MVIDTTLAKLGTPSKMGGVHLALLWLLLTGNGAKM
jgi:hypothetical protein